MTFREEGCQQEVEWVREVGWVGRGGRGPTRPFMDSYGVQGIVLQEDPDDPQAVGAHRPFSHRGARHRCLCRSGRQKDRPAPDQALVARDVWRRNLYNDHSEEVEGHEGHEEAGVEIEITKTRNDKEAAAQTSHQTLRVGEVGSVASVNS